MTDEELQALSDRVKEGNELKERIGHLQAGLRAFSGAISVKVDSLGAWGIVFHVDVAAEKWNWRSADRKLRDRIRQAIHAALTEELNASVAELESL